MPRGLHPAVIAFIRTRPDLLEQTEPAMARGELIAATPRSWERVSAILRAIPDRRQRDVMIAGSVGEAVAAEFALVAEDIAATVRVDEMLATLRAARPPLYPATLHGLHALVYGLAGTLDAGNVARIVEIAADIARLPALRSDPALPRLPLAELTTHGFEVLIARGLALGLEDAFLDAPAYRDYAEERQAAGLA